MPFGQWLDIQQQPESLVRKLYDPIVISGLNENTRDASAAYAIQIFQEALLENAGGYVFGMPNCTLTELYRSLPIRGLRLGTRVNGLRFEGGRVTGVELVGGEVLECSSVVLATNFHTISRWIPDPLRKTDRRFDHLDKLQSVPILGVHLWFDRPVMTESHCAFVRGPLQWVFRKDESGSAVHGVISAARNWLDRDRDQMAREFEVQVRAMLPMARNAKLQRSQVVIEKRATFSPSPGVDQYRPTQSPDEHGIPNLYLAGDYTKTGWPATMEGAVRSGYAAAGAIVGTQFIVRDLEKQWGARIMGE
jgi:hypothetical protein